MESSRATTKNDLVMNVHCHSSLDWINGNRSASIADPCFVNFIRSRLHFITSFLSHFQPSNPKPCNSWPTCPSFSATRVKTKNWKYMSENTINTQKILRKPCKWLQFTIFMDKTDSNQKISLLIFQDICTIAHSFVDFGKKDLWWKIFWNRPCSCKVMGTGSFTVAIKMRTKCSIFASAGFSKLLNAFHFYQFLLAHWRLCGAISHPILQIFCCNPNSIIDLVESYKWL